MYQESQENSQGDNNSRSPSRGTKSTVISRKDHMCNPNDAVVYRDQAAPAVRFCSGFISPALPLTILDSIPHNQIQITKIFQI